jgi:hypothetical protein|tara:strand:- start:1030 stop:1404 length:375 start_codon:yes stop_codon:yes gene_type:complete
MATDFAIRIRIDENGSGGVTSDQIPIILQKIIAVLNAQSLVLTHAATYTAGDRTYNAVVDVNTITAADYGIEVLIDSTVSASKKASILSRILQVLANFTLVLSALNTSYVAGSTSVNKSTITVT